MLLDAVYWELSFTVLNRGLPGTAWGDLFWMLLAAGLERMYPLKSIHCKLGLLPASVWRCGLWKVVRD